jgi:hypothetical protein
MINLLDEFLPSLTDAGPAAKRGAADSPLAMEPSSLDRSREVVQG